jgi:hypothetical protein
LAAGRLVSADYLIAANHLMAGLAGTGSLFAAHCGGILSVKT